MAVNVVLNFAYFNMATSQKLTLPQFLSANFCFGWFSSNHILKGIKKWTCPGLISWCLRKSTSYAFHNK